MAAPLIVETERLILRPFAIEDAESAHGWFGDPTVMRHTPTGADASVAATRDRLATYVAHQAAHGFSKWMIVERASGRPIGDAGLLDLDQLDWIDLGFRLARTSWGQGLATEAAAAWVRTAFLDLGLRQLGAFCHPDNAASIRVLEKLGFRPQRRDTIMGMDSVYFDLASGK